MQCWPLVQKRFGELEDMWIGTNWGKLLKKMGVELDLKFPDVKNKRGKRWRKVEEESMHVWKVKYKAQYRQKTLHFLLQLIFTMLSSAALSNMLAASHMWLFKFKLIKKKWNLKFSSSGALATFQVASGYCIEQCEYKTHPSLQEVLS